MPNKQTIAAALGLALATSTATAEPQWYLTAGLSLTDLETDSLVEAVQEFGLEASDEASDTAFGYQIGVGAKLTDIFGVELRYGETGEAKDGIGVSNGMMMPTALPDDITGNRLSVKAELDGFTLYGVAERALTDNWAIFGKLGYTWQDGEITLRDAVSSVKESDDDDGIAVAAGARYQFTPNWALAGEIEYWDVDFDGAIEEPLRATLNVLYYFR